MRKEIRLKRYIKGTGEKVRVIGTGWAVLTDIHTGEVTKIRLKNVVTNDGDQYYAQSAVGETPAFTVAGCRLGTGVTTPTKSDTDVTTFFTGGGKATKATYPKTNDGDSDNTGSGVDKVTWCFEFSESEGNQADIAEIAIVDNISTPTVALSHALFASTFTKTTSNTLKIFVNHEILGA